MILKINLNYGRKAKDVAQISDIENTSDYILFAVRSVYKDGLDNQWRRMWARIQRKLDDAVDKKKEEVDFEQGEKDFMKKAVNDAKVPADLAKFWVVLEDEFNREEPKDSTKAKA